MNIELQQKLNLAVQAQKEWREVSFEKRQELLKNLSKNILENHEEYSQMIREKCTSLFHNQEERLRNVH